MLPEGYTKGCPTRTLSLPLAFRSSARIRVMQLCKAQLETGEIRVGVVSDDHVRFLDLQGYLGLGSLSDILHSDNPATAARDLVDDRIRTESLRDLTLLAPLDRQEVWAAGVTYKR